MIQIHKNLDKRKAMQLAEELGGTVAYNKTGEIRVSFPLEDGHWRRFNINYQRKDVPQVLLSFMRQRQQSLANAL